MSLPPLQAGVDRITAISVCTRPFRAQGPRIELERIGDKDVIHQYGHGGSGWSLSWGSGAIATDMAMRTGARDIAVIGCGAIGLTTAVLLQRAGARVTIYAKELPPDVRSSAATGVWSPDSRICLEQHATPAFKVQWEAMTRHSFGRFQNMLGLPGNPVEWIDSYYVADPGGPAQAGPDTRPRFAVLRRELVPDLSIKALEYAPGNHPFGDRVARRYSFMMYNLTAYADRLLSDFRATGGRTEIREFRGPADFAALKEKTLVNCTGYGARALMRDESVVPVRGQLARMPPQPGVGYGLFYNQVSFVPRRDGLVFQFTGPDDYYGYGDEGTAPDRAEAERAVGTIASLFAAV
ncbi:FAD-dependent oxidoreductase [Aerophototrophica crusticola]|uniref:D-amino-acid oxidase n=1 Tax=Aerophototrophica crusticola TaxID=1709002 RepID=A0A858R6M7_9PROT|nr:FAD-dependent oxidoreductase [Rhodospirillaceae bacterium B3]